MSKNLSLKDRSELNKLVALAEQTIKEMDSGDNEGLKEVKDNIERLKESVEKLIHNS
jgi:predicted transcriptional regulator